MKKIFLKTPPPNDAKPLLYDDIKIGMQVVDKEGDVGIVKEANDQHNIVVDFGNGGSGLYCLVIGCEEGSDNLYIFI
jgi:hypothetical protein